MSDMFWLNNPSILFNKKHLVEIWPSNNLSYDGKLNAITRLVVILSILGYLITKSIKILISSGITLLIIAIIYKVQKHKKSKKKIAKKIFKEGFSSCKEYECNKPEFTTPSQKNPLMNVLLTEINDNPKRKAAAPSFDKNVEKEINAKVHNNEIMQSQDLNSKLFLDLGDNIDFESSMRNFYSMPNTKVCSDQKKFAEFCYGNMPSCKEGNEFQCAKNNQRYLLY